MNASKNRTKKRKFDDGGVIPTATPAPIAAAPTPAPAVDPNTTVGPPAGRLYQSIPASRQQVAPTPKPTPTPTPTPSANDRMAQRKARILAQRTLNANLRKRQAAAQRAKETAESSIVRKMYAANPTAMKYNPNGPDKKAVAYWNDKIKTQGLGAVQGGGFSKEVDEYAAANPMKKGGTVKPKAYAKGGAITSKPVKSMARGGGCEVKGKTKGRFV